jgi:DNA-binding MarR family transcriptional regulator
MFHLLMHIGHLLEERCRSGLAEYGLHHGQARVLMALHREEGVIQARLAGGMHIAPATLSLMLKKLVAQGLVQLTADGKDERVHRLSLTAGGRRAVKRVTTVWDAAYRTIIDSVEPQERATLHAHLLPRLFKFSNLSTLAKGYQADGGTGSAITAGAGAASVAGASDAIGSANSSSICSR